jgi:hypothetical protein
VFERFTEEARRVVVLAQEEARAAGDPCIDGAHLLLALTLTGGPGGAALHAGGLDAGRVREALRATGAGSPADAALDAEALSTLGIDLDRVQRAAEAVFGSGALARPARRFGRRRRASGHLPFTRRAKEALTQSLRAALRRGDREITSRHLLIGVLVVGDDRTSAVLRRLGADPAALLRDAEGGAAAA